MNITHYFFAIPKRALKFSIAQQEQTKNTVIQLKVTTQWRLFIHLKCIHVHEDQSGSCLNGQFSKVLADLSTTDWSWPIFIYNKKKKKKIWHVWFFANTWLSVQIIIFNSFCILWFLGDVTAVFAFCSKTFKQTTWE